MRIARVVPRRRRFRLGRDVRKIAVGIALLLLILFGQEVVGAATAGGRLDDSLRRPTGPSNIVVVLDFTPERFHNERLAQYGVFAGRDGSVSRVRLRMVSPDNLERLSRLAWVSRIEPLKPRPATPRPAAPAAPAK